MIIAIVETGQFLQDISLALEAEGLRLDAFGHASTALEAALQGEPDLIMLDLDDAGQQSLAFIKEHAREALERGANFLLLGQCDRAGELLVQQRPEQVQCLPKPVDQGELLAKIKSMLGQVQKSTVATFHGDLSKLPFVRLMLFCEAKGLTGDVDIEGGDLCARLTFRGGAFLHEDVQDADIERLYDLHEGTFTIYARSFDFSELADAVAPQAEPGPGASKEKKPMGLLSGVRFDRRLFQLQTEYVTYPETQVVTIVVLDGRVVNKRVKEVPLGAERRAIEKLMEQFHKQVEEEVRAKCEELLSKKKKTEESAEQQAWRLLDEGYVLYRAGNFKEALELLQLAQGLKPGDRILETNVKMLRKRLGI